MVRTVFNALVLCHALALLCLLWFIPGPSCAAEMGVVKVSQDKKGFVQESGEETDRWPVSHLLGEAGGQLPTV